MTAPFQASSEGRSFGQERRLVTVLFADFVGFTTLAEELDPEELQQLVSGIFEDLAEEAVRYDGTIEKFIGDAIFVIFGAPVAHEDDPQRAIRTAMGMQRAFADHALRLKRDRGIELGLRMGIHTGMVVAGGVRIGSEYGVMGDTVNIASRLQSAAAPGEIWVTQATFRLAQREFSFREVGPIEMKGRDLPVLAYALTGERTDIRVSIELNAPLVGRWMELSRIDLAYQSSRVGRTEVVLISGEPGIGKSRLVSEFIGLSAGEEGARAEDQPRVLRWTFSRVNQRSYAGFIEPLLVELGIDTGAADSAQRLEEKLASLRFTKPGQSAPVLAQFLHLPGVKEPEMESEEWKRSMYFVVYDTLAALARERPLIIVLEDLHYADSASLDLLWFVASRATRVPILILLAQRLGAGSPEARPTRTNFTQLVLEPLPDDEAARIIESTIDWAPAELRDKIVARAGGNPFFIEESIRSLVESGAVSRDEEGEWVVRQRLASLEVPATLHAVVASRIDRLPPIAKECIQLASVIGQRFGDRVLRAAGGDHIAAAVDTLISADLVLEAAPGERREGRYRFKHAVTQEVAYNTLLVRRRTELHRKVAAAFEEALGEEVRDFYPALAHHYLLGEVPEKAAEYAWKAAQRAVSIHAHLEALRFAEQTVEVSDKIGDLDRAIEALHLVARVRRFRGEYDAALAAYERALALVEPHRSERTDEIASLYAHMAELVTRWDAKHPDLEALIARGLELVGDETSRERVLLLAARAFAPRKSPKPTDEDWEEALRTAKEALAIAEELGQMREVSLCLDAVGFAYRELGRFRESYQVNQRRVPIAQTLQDSDELIDAHTMLAIAANVLGDVQQAIEQAVTAREIALETEKPNLGLQALGVEAAARLWSGDFAGAVETARRADQFGSVSPSKTAASFAIAMAASAALGSLDEKLYRDRLVEAEVAPHLLGTADLVTAVYGQRRNESAYHGIRSAGAPRARLDRIFMGPLAVLAAARWSIEDEAFEERVSTDVQRSGYARGQALLVQAQGLRALRRGEHARAEQLLLDALQALATQRAEYDRAVALVDHAEALERLGRASEAAKELDEARSAAERFGAVALRNVIDAIATRV